MYLKSLFQNLVGSHENNKSERPTEVITLDESCAVDKLTSEISNVTVDEAMQNVCDQKSQEKTTKTTGEVCAIENERLDEQKVCRCNCTCRNSVEVELEGMKLDMTILESRLVSVLSIDEIKSEINYLKEKQNNMEVVIRPQDELISKLNEENMVLKSKLFSFEYLVQCNGNPKGHYMLLTNLTNNWKQHI